MFPGLPRNRENCRIYTIANAATRIALKGDDPDFIILRVIDTSFNGATVALPHSSPIGKTFTFFLVCDPVLNPTISSERISIRVPSIHHPAGTPTGSFLLGAGQEPRFLYTPDGWLTPRGMGQTGDRGADGYNSSQGIAFGEGASAADQGAALGNGALAYTSGAAVGVNANANTRGASVGLSANSNTDGVAVGDAASGSSLGVGVGRAASGANNGVAVGYQASSNNMDVAVALGKYSKAERYRELVKSADGASTCLRSFSILDWYGDTTGATPAELLLGGTAAQRAVLLNSSAFLFKLLAVARDDTNNDCAMWELTGGIKRGANAAATAIVGAITKVLIAADTAAAAWDIDAVADTTNGSLKLNVTGQTSKTIRWNVRGDLSELRF